MSYFNKFPTVGYDVRGDGITTTMTDITRRVRVSTKARLSTVEYDYYDVIDGQTPEFIADRYYGDVGLHWLVLMTNDIIDAATQAAEDSGALRLISLLEGGYDLNALGESVCQHMTALEGI